MNVFQWRFGSGSVCRDTSSPLVLPSGDGKSKYNVFCSGHVKDADGLCPALPGGLRGAGTPRYDSREEYTPLAKNVSSLSLVLPPGDGKLLPLPKLSKLMHHRRFAPFPAAARLLLGALVFFAFCLPAAAEEEAGYTGKTFYSVVHDVPFAYAGTIDDVLVSPGDRVQKGQILARYRLKDETLLDILTYLDLQRVVLNTQIEIIEKEKATLSVKQDYDSLRRLSAAKMGSADELQQLKSTLELLNRQKALLTQRMELDKKYLQARREIVKHKLGKHVEGTDVPEYGELLSPLEGEVVFIHPALRKGMILDAFPQAITVARTNPMEIRLRVYEADIPELQTGGKATVRIPSLGDRDYDGVITYIDRSPEDMTVGRPSYYGVRVEVSNDDGKLRAGFQSTVTFALDTNVRSSGGGSGLP